MNTALQPYAEKVATFTDLTADTNQTAFTLPKMNEYNFYLTVTSITGTASPMDVSLQITPDGGTTWLTFARFDPVDATNGKLTQRMRFRPYSGEGDEAGVDDVAIIGGALAKNGPLPGTTARFHVEETGTVTDFDATIWLIGNVAETGY